MGKGKTLDDLAEERVARHLEALRAIADGPKPRPLFVRRIAFPPPLMAAMRAVTLPCGEFIRPPRRLRAAFRTPAAEQRVLPLPWGQRGTGS